MNSTNIKNFLEQRLEHLKSSTAENYTRNFSAMVDSLKNNNISISVDKEIFNSFVKEVKAKDTSSVEIFRAVSNFQSLQDNLFQRHEMSAVLAEIQYQMGYRISEAIEVIKNFKEYFNRSSMQLKGVKGKGGREYIPKEISKELVGKIENIENKISKSTYDKDLRKEGIKSHDLRISFAKNKYEREIEKDSSYKETFANTSKELNHNRGDITQYYLNRA